MKIIAITQARVGSSRLPHKILKKIDGKSLLAIHLKRILQSSKISSLIVATTFEDGVEGIVDICKKSCVDYHQGDQHDVLGRFYGAVKDKKPDFVVRLTSDCPLIDPILIDDIITFALEVDVDYVSNTLNPTFPDGQDVEVFKFSALEMAYHEANDQIDREHVTPYIWRNSTFKGKEKFSSKNYENAEDFSKIRMTVDEKEDFEVISDVISKLGTESSWLDYASLLNTDKNIAIKNSKFQRNEGFYKNR